MAQTEVLYYMYQMWKTHLQHRVGLLGDGLQVVHGGLGGNRGSGALLGRSEGGSRGNKGGEDGRLHFRKFGKKI